MPRERIKPLEFAVAQLRHAYANLVGAPGIQGPPLTPEAAREFAEGLIAPQIRRIEAEIARQRAE